ncbi:hypothetical protein CC_2571 [Caulobacter vibrioides CB15]|uniref:Uncharacterized protein n=1 Tax=Caulobacter vibrioides (strain ATCC 19089 / CIP 103742 / CB 15) TaxID=190650 RepID=Q9A586_CAUVC|nr:hypothetical protein CC_2571 [Caulobacter vibrioides CB15]
MRGDGDETYERAEACECGYLEDARCNLLEGGVEREFLYGLPHVEAVQTGHEYAKRRAYDPQLSDNAPPGFPACSDRQRGGDKRGRRRCVEQGQDNPLRGRRVLENTPERLWHRDLLIVAS